MLWLLSGGVAWGQPPLSLPGQIARVERALADSTPARAWHWARQALEQARDQQNLATEVTLHLTLADHPALAAHYETMESHLSRLRRLQAEGTLLGAAQSVAHQELGYVYYFLAQERIAVQHFEQAHREALRQQQVRPRYEALMGCATALNNLGQSGQALACLREALPLTRREQAREAETEVLTQLATIYVAIGQLDSAHHHFEALLARRRAADEDRILASDLHHAGNVWLQQGRLDRAQAYLFEALDLTTELGDSLLKAALLTDIAAVFTEQGDWGKTLHYAEQGARLAQRHELAHLAARNYRRSGQALEHLQQPQAALSAYQQALVLHEERLPNPAERVKLQMHIAELLEAEADYAAAARLLLAALAQKARSGDKLGMLDLHLSLADLYLRHPQAGAAWPHLEAADTLSHVLKSLTGQARTVQLQAQLLAREGRFQAAYQRQLAYQQLHDSVFTLEKTQVVHELEARYRTAEKDRRNAELGAEVTRKQLMLEQNKRVIVEKNRQLLLLIGSVATLAFGLVFYRYRYLKRRELLQARLANLEKNREAETLRAVISGEEQERERIARELHDGLGSQLASIKMLVSAIQNDLPTVVHSATHQRAELLLDQACQEVRDTSHHLMPGALARYGLAQAIRDLCITLEQSHPLCIDCLVHLHRPVEVPVAISVYRITQELLRNVVKHAQAREVIVQLQAEEDHLHLTVEDDGQGFVADVHRQQGIGLRNLRSRVALLKGSIDLDSRPGEGTSIYIHIPWQPAAAEDTSL